MLRIAARRIWTHVFRFLKAASTFVGSFRLLALVSASLLLISVASDWPLGVLSNFWSSHSLLANLYSSALFVVLGISVVERYLRKRNDRHIALVAAVASDAAGRGPLSQWRTMWFLVNGGEYTADLDFSIAFAKIAGIKRALQRNGLPEVDESEVRSGTASLPDLTARLTILTNDRQWVSLTHDILREFTFRFRALIARWSPLLASTTESANVLLDLAAQAQELTDLFIRLRPIARQGRASLTLEEFAQFNKRWRTALCNAVVLDEALAHFSGQPRFPWSAGSRLLLAESDRDLVGIAQRKHSGSVRIHSLT